MHVQPYLFFDGRCEEAVEFYQKTLGAEVMMLMRFQDSPEPPQPGMVPPGSEHKVMHTSFRIGEDDGDGLRRSLRRAAELPGLCAVAHGAGRRPRPSSCSLRWPRVGRCRCR